jgi:S1-C subfamily serine protease
VSYQSVTDDIADSFGLDRARGVLVANVVADGPAAKAGLKRNDIILSFSGQDVLDLRRFPRLVANARLSRQHRRSRGLPAPGQGSAAESSGSANRKRPTR